MKQSPFSQLIEYTNRINNLGCKFKNLSSENPLYVSKICNVDILLNFFENQNSKDVPFVSNNSKIFMAYIPFDSKTLMNVFTKGYSMEQIDKKFNKYGLAIEGCFGIRDKKNAIPSISIFNAKLPKAFMVIDDHKITTIVDYDDIDDYEVAGTVYYIPGRRLYTGGIPIVSFEKNENNRCG